MITKDQIIEIIETQMSKSNDKSNKFYKANEWETIAKIKKCVEKCTTDFADVIGVLHIASCGVLVLKTDTIGISFKNLIGNVNVEIPYEELMFVSKVFLKNGKVSKDFYCVYYLDEEKKIKRSEEILCLDQKMTYEILRCIIEAQQDIADEEDYFDYFFECNRNNDLDFSAKMSVLETIKERNYTSERSKKYVRTFDLIEISEDISEAQRNGLKLYAGYTVQEIKKLVTFQWKDLQKDAANDCFKYLKKNYDKNQDLLFDGMNLNILEYYQQYLRIIMHISGLGEADADISAYIINDFNRKMDELYIKLEEGAILESATNCLGLKEEPNDDCQSGLFSTYKLIGDLFLSRKVLANSRKGHKWYDKALEIKKADEMSGYSDIMYEKALLYRDGNGDTEPSVDKMLEYAQIGASYHDGNCENLLSQHYFDNDDEINGEKWKKRAKEHGVKPDAEYDKSMIDKIEMRVGSIEKQANALGALIGAITGLSGVGKDITQAKLNMSEVKKNEKE